MPSRRDLARRCLEPAVRPRPVLALLCTATSLVLGVHLALADPAPVRPAPAVDVRPPAAPAVTAAPAVVAAPAVTAAPAVIAAPAPGTGWPALDAAISRIPGYATVAPARWTVSARYGHWGSTELRSQDITISPAVPVGRLDAVVRHEWSHVLQARAYGGDVDALVADLDAAFGGGAGTAGVERAADCMARELGARWTHYTPCADAGWQARARDLLAGHRVSTSGTL